MHPIWHVLHIMHEKNMLTPEQQVLVDPMAEEELYNVEQDPYEIHNLATLPAYHDLLEDMRERLEKWQEETVDHGMRPDPPELEEHFRQYGKTSEALHANLFRELEEQIKKEMDLSEQ
jgi:arylsulfatase A-like enzyme